MIGDQDELPLKGMQANVLVDGFRARVLLDCYYYNDRSQRLEGSFKLRLPDEASLYYFAFGESSFQYRPAVDQLASTGFLSADLLRAGGTGPQDILRARSDTWSNVKEARLVPRETAALAYGETVRRRIDPALVEWSGAGVFNARVFPLMPNKLHRIVIGYDVNLQSDGGDLVYRLDLPDDLPECMVDLNVAALPGTSAEITPPARPFTAGGRAYFNFKSPDPPTISLRFPRAGTVLLTGNDAAAGDFFATQFAPELPAGEATDGSSHALFLVDTSLSSNPDKFNVWLKLLETTLDKNRDKMQDFAVLFFNVESHWWKPQYVKNTPQNVELLRKYCETLALEGATDLRQALAEAVRPSWAVGDRLPRPDLFLLSDGAITWGEPNVHAITQTLKSGTGGTLFAYKTGLTGTASEVLEHLARESGGAVFSVTGEEEVERAATAHRSRPWQLVDVSLAGGSDVLIAGRPRAVYPGQRLMLVGRGQPAPNAAVMLQLRRDGKEHVVHVPLDRSIQSELAPRLYGQVAVGQLEDLQDATHDISVAYARHFRVTGQTCSLLMLDSEADYQRFNIKTEDDLLIVRSTAAGELIAGKLNEFAQQLADPKQALRAWLTKLEQVPGVNFKISTSLQLLLDRTPAKSMQVVVPRLVCKQRTHAELPKEFLRELSAEQLNYDAISDESTRRREKYGPADALKALSSLVENNPGDPVLLRDVAFSAIDWGLGGQAYDLLRRVADARPYEPQTYLALAQCLADLGHADLAMVYYEVALTGQWNERYRDFRQVAGVEYLHLLRRIDRGEASSQSPEFVKARMQSLFRELPVNEAGLLVTMMWNTDRTDVDLHVLEPSGEECYYKNPRSRAGGQVTRDVTEGFGPEMYWLRTAQLGPYVVKANYYRSDANRVQVRTKVYVTVYEDFGGQHETVTKRAITLGDASQKRDIMTVKVQQP
jgi:tetratricopeptide (TPR) repeat protein